MNSDMEENDRPMEPLESDCCGQGCSMCVFDIYEAELKNYKNSLNTTRESTSSVLSPDHYKEFRVTNIKETEVESVYIFRFNADYVFMPGEHLMAKRRTKEGSITRQYSILYSCPNYFEILVKIYENGRFTSSLLDDWVLGSSVSFRGPFSGFDIKSPMNDMVVFVSGTGLAPLFSIFKSILDNHEFDDTNIICTISFKNWSNIFNVEEIRGLAEYCNFTLRIYLSDKSCDNEKVKRQLSRVAKKVDYFRINEHEVHEILKPFSNLVNLNFIICGSKLYEKDIESFILSCRGSNNNIVKL